MLKTRVIPVVLYNGSIVVKSINFKRTRNIGNPCNVVRVFNAREVDELVFLDISATKTDKAPDLSLISEIAGECFMPLAIGGGIKTLEQVGAVLKAGADKVCLNSVCFTNPELITQTALRFGNQSVIVCIDVVKENSDYYVFRYDLNQYLNLDPVNWALEVERLGAGEIFLCSVSREGEMDGFDLDLIKAVSSAVKIPVIASGGAGELDDFCRALKNGASAVSAASIFHFTECTPMEVKLHLNRAGYSARI